MVFGSFIDCTKLKNREEMVREVEDVEEGEISDTASVEEISAEDFNKQDDVKVNDSNNKPKSGGGDDARVWAVHNLYSKYSKAGLYQLAWAQGVQNKPLNDIFVMESECDSNAKGNSNKKENDSKQEVVIVDVDKEDGELEEGEIDADADPETEGGVDASEFVSETELLGVRDVLQGVTVANVVKSFAETCTRLDSAYRCKVFSAPAVAEKDDLVRLSFNAIEVVYSVFCSMDNLQKEENKDNISRLLSSVKYDHAHLFSLEHMKEIEVMITAINSIGASGKSEAVGKEGKLETPEIKTQEILAVKADGLISSSKFVHGNSNEASEALKSGQSNIKGRVISLPLFDLHKDHDLDSLPSPTREAPSCFPVNKSFSVREGMSRSWLPPVAKTEAGKMDLNGEDLKLHLYETDAFKAVSTYQQKFGRSSLFTTDKLPSPTPSGDCEAGVADTNDEVSSPFVASLTTSKPILLDQMPVSSTFTDSTSVNNSRIDTASSGSHLVKTSAKSRDPRLRFINSDASGLDFNQPSGVHNMPKVEYAGTTISRKQKTTEEHSLDANVPKRLKSPMENPEYNMREVRTVAGNGGCLEETTVARSQFIERNHLMQKGEAEPNKTMNTSTGDFIVTCNGNEQAPVTSSNTPVSLPTLLKGIKVNHSMLLDLLREQQQRLAAEATSTPHMISSNFAKGTDATVNMSAAITTDLPQSSVGMRPVSSHATSMVQSRQEDSAKIRMKPRDPRRILHGSNTLQKSGSLGSEQFKAIAPSISNQQGTEDNACAQKLDTGIETKLAPTQSIAQPDITRQFTSNLKNIADLMSVSQESSSHSPATQNLSSASVPFTFDRVEQKSAVSNSQNLKAGTGSAPETCATGSSRSQSTWADVEHLFEGYDVQQKAAIQRERARRLEEQNKMFAARKLCLVLDLDHTLLNSAKFVEVDLVHDEILRKKEEQDRENPQRHLFRFAHMGMWTKLRPGVWNFLEKASKLYELHLYTMGNKLYATEMAKVLDPKGVLFAGRVISRGDDTESLDGDERVPKIKDLEGVLGMESAVVIIDDSVRVWPHNKPNLIMVERYTYFPCSRRQFGLSGPSLLEVDHDERPEAGTLASCLGVIERIHQIFFASQSLEEADVRNILASEQKKVLAGCRIVFSRMFPVGEANPHLHPLWQTAEQFGAVCTSQVDDQVTHVVATHPGTDKVNWALNTGRFVVHPSWVEASSLLYRRANEQDFAIKPEK